MKLKELLKIAEIPCKLNNQILSKNVAKICYLEDEVDTNSVFAAIKEYRHYNKWSDGHQFIDKAIEKNPIAIVGEQNFNFLNYIKVNDSRIALAKLAHAFYGSPFNNLINIGVTGTNGKTTTTHLIGKIVEKQGLKRSIIGTVGYYIDDVKLPAIYTTPLALELSKLGKLMIDKNVKVNIMEVSSHSLELDRVYGIPFKIAVFTNLTQDHLDFHKTMENYFNAKLKLFLSIEKDPNIKYQAILNADSKYSKKIIEKIKINYLTYGIKNKLALIKPLKIKKLWKKQLLKIKLLNTAFDIETNLLGDFNIYNILAAISTCYSMGISIDAIKDGIKDFKGAPGRFQIIEISNKAPLIIIDYAHTPDALQRVLVTAKQFNQNKLWVVFGCGGDRDKLKRPIMGKIAVENAHKCVITSDNPRTEDPEKIIADIKSGIPQKYLDKCYFITDRTEAIIFALQNANKNDIILIAGKGHENYQIIGTKKIPYSDEEVVRNYFKGS